MTPRAGLSNNTYIQECPRQFHRKSERGEDMVSFDALLKTIHIYSALLSHLDPTRHTHPSSAGLNQYVAEQHIAAIKLTAKHVHTAPQKQDSTGTSCCWARADQANDPLPCR